MARVPAWRQGGPLHDFSAAAGIDNAQIAVLDLQTGTSKVLIRGGSHAHYVADRASGLRCRGHVARRGLRPRTAGGGRDGDAGAEGVMTTQFGAADFALAANGSLVYVPGAAGGRCTLSCWWIGRDIPRRCLVSLWTRIATSGCRPTARGSRWRPRRMCDVRRRARDAEPADDRPCPRPQPAVDARWAAHHLYVE